jgi:hypothetical protein
MCMNCGCGEVDQRHGNDANLVTEDVRRAADAAGLDMSATVRNLQDSLQKMGAEAAVGASGRAGSSDQGQDARGRSARG